MPSFVSSTGFVTTLGSSMFLPLREILDVAPESLVLVVDNARSPKHSATMEKQNTRKRQRRFLGSGRSLSLEDDSITNSSRWSNCTGERGREPPVRRSPPRRTRSMDDALSESCDRRNSAQPVRPQSPTRGRERRGGRRSPRRNRDSKGGANKVARFVQMSLADLTKDLTMTTARLSVRDDGTIGGLSRQQRQQATIDLLSSALQQVEAFEAEIPILST